MVVVAEETELDSARAQPSGPPVAAGAIPGTAAVVTQPPAFEVLIGKLDEDVFAFHPKQVTILSGQSVRWTNVAPSFIVPHTATREVEEDGKAIGIADDQQETLEFDSGEVAPNASFVRAFTLPPEPPLRFSVITVTRIRI